VAPVTVALGVAIDTVVVGAGEIAGLDPHASAAVAAAALVVGPLAACVFVALLVLGDRTIHALSHREQHDPAEHEDDAAEPPPRHVFGEHAPGDERREDD
jgi:hypothetical protein